MNVDVGKVLSDAWDYINDADQLRCVGAEDEEAMDNVIRTLRLLCQAVDELNNRSCPPLD